LTGFSIGSFLIHNDVFSEGQSRHILVAPDQVSIETMDGWFEMKSSDKQNWRYEDTNLELKMKKVHSYIYIQSPKIPLKKIRCMWKYPIPSTALVLGDHYERTYGDVHWRPVSERVKMPWYMIESEGDNTFCFGVKTGAATICHWEADGESISLVLDTRSGGDAVSLGDRLLHAATIVLAKNSSHENAFATVRRFCGMMCDNPRKAPQPVYGINDWYFAYGDNSAELILQHTELVAPLVTNTSNKPFSVIDAGWADGEVCALSNTKFGDMSKLASQIKELGMRPGLWTRLLCADEGTDKSLLLPAIANRNDPKKAFMDPTIYENQVRIRNLLISYRQWGYQLIKHDYSTFDLLGRWGFQMMDDLTEPNWHFADQSKTNAEIIMDLYGLIREGSGDAVLLGCNTMSHLAAGFFEINRIGDDTSGLEWERTRKMGVNTLGFRLVQQGKFYDADGDCVGITPRVPWDKNLQWLELVAYSGAPLFISADPSFVEEDQKKAIRRGFALASRVQPVGEPLDWLSNALPADWKLDGKEMKFNWG
jgi:alpha-galactosidase